MTAYKWVCLGVAVAFMAVLLWMVNDVRVTMRKSLANVDATGKTVNEHLPVIVERSRAVTESVSAHLPEVVAKVQKATEVMAELSEDVNQLKELAGVTGTARDKNLVAYADGVLKAVAASHATLGLKKAVGRGLKDTLPAAEWVAGARKEALFLTLLVRSKREMATRLATTKLGFHWYVRAGDAEPVPLLDWLKEHHAETREAFAEGGKGRSEGKE